MPRSTQAKVHLQGWGQIVLLTILTSMGGSACAEIHDPPYHDSAAMETATGATVLKVDSGRPLDRAALVLQALYGYVITYEEPRYTNGEDLVDTAPSVIKGYSTFKPGTAPRLIVPKAKQLTLRLPSAKAISADDLAKLLQELVAQQGSAAYGGHFQVRRNGDVFHIVPTEVRTQEGNWAPQTSLLDIPISFPEQDRTVGATYNAIAAAVSSATGFSLRVYTGSALVMGGERPAQSPHTTMGAVNEPARSVLLRALAASSVKRTWRLVNLTEDGPNFFLLDLSPMPSDVTTVLY